MNKTLYTILLGILFVSACEEATLQKGRGQLNVEPEVIDFGKVTQGQRELRNIVVTNQGAVAVDVVANFTESSSSDFTIDQNMYTIGPRGIMSVEVSFQAIGSGMDLGELQFKIAGEDALASVKLQAGPIDPRLRVEPDPVDFAPTMSALEMRNVKLLNIGQADLTIETIGTDRESNPDFSLNPVSTPLSISPESSTQITVSYAQTASAGEGRLVIKSNAPTQPEYVLRLLPDPSHDCSDGEDNDGDGLIDFPDDPGCDDAKDDDEYNMPECETGTVSACGTDVGICEFGERECVHGLWGPCEGAVSPEPESCDGEDNDCDRRTDEELTETCTLNGCNGVRSCIESSTIAGGQWSPCLPLQAMPETCDGNDNDCDGTIDEGIIDMCVINTCAGTRICVPGGTGQYGRCLPTNPGTEICDGMDNDCNGIADENLGDLSCGLGACQQTVTACVNGITQVCTPGMPSTETCNNIDDDCDGSIDNLGDTTCGIGACEVTLPQCLLGIPISCIPDPPSAEICNNIDDDCDGVIDNVGTSTCGLGLCTRYVPSCLAGVTQICSPGTPTTEVCNNSDDDCNGIVDDLGVQSCGIGACLTTVQQCVAGVPQACTPGMPTTEVCNNSDDDCDGITDNVGSLNCGVGACLRTVPECITGVTQTCTPGTPTTEVCNNIDDDCNGLVDDVSTLNCGVGACERNVPSCIAGVPQTCTPGTPTTESCNNIDDDCNGNIDDIGVWNCGTGACERTVQQCIAGVSQSCTPGTPTTEICNNADDDCNGTVDDLGTTTCGSGACERTVQQCVAGVSQTCTPGSPVGETCNNVDDDCNGTIDDLGTVSCGTGACTRTVDYCVAGVIQACVPGAGVSEICNNTDDDCNGLIDDLGTTSCGVGACERTTQQCISGVQQSCTPGSPVSETCNNQDDDCNGTIDDVGTSTCGIGACERSIPVCIAGVAQTCTPGIPVTEVCNNEDDDCNGTIDDVGTITCGLGVCVNIVQSCVAGVPQSCTPLPTTGTDNNCNTVDEDCDGTADEHYPSTAITCGQGVCLRNGSRTCVSGAVTDQCTPGSPTSTNDATCDMQDDDCDGLIDEDCTMTTNYSGNWTMDRTIAYTCASFLGFNLVDINFNSFSINDTNPNITLTPPFRSGVLAQQPGGTSGIFTGNAPPQFTSTNSLLGGCDEHYTFTGSFTGTNMMAGTFSVEFVPNSAGACQDCTNQLFVFSATR